ncbi:hypothetical protein ACFW0H_27020 [Pseudomonas sp. CR3202]|uniref:hypothetical protein n=1 Tax=Pseudomonas sp. CR3202 TaxID=3351532 RepID=UPI003BF2F945
MRRQPFANGCVGLELGIDHQIGDRAAATEQTLAVIDFSLPNAAVVPYVDSTNAEAFLAMARTQ